VKINKFDPTAPKSGEFTLTVLFGLAVPANVQVLEAGTYVVVGLVEAVEVSKLGIEYVTLPSKKPFVIGIVLD
jgi:hypothetical protein